MNKIVIAVGIVVIGLLLAGGGFIWGQANAQAAGPGDMMGSRYGSTQPGYGMMAGSVSQDGSGYGMMGGRYGNMMGSMMGGQYGDIMGGMMGGYGNLANAEPLSIDEAEAAVAGYLAALGDDNLALGEVMIFDNHAYAQVLDVEAGRGAFEVLVDPVTGDVYPEPGPNMMWNTEYGMMIGQFGGMMGMMMGGQYGGMMGGGFHSAHHGTFAGNPEGDSNAANPLTGAEAVAIAQMFLDTNLPGLVADDHADAFPGYYTLHVERDGQITGMLSVYSAGGQVFVHHWHGNFIEMADGDQD